MSTAFVISSVHAKLGLILPAWHEVYMEYIVVMLAVFIALHILASMKADGLEYADWEGDV